MKKILITGAAGTLGISVIKHLLNENYEITATDVMTKNNFNKLKKYQSKINIVYGEITNEILIESLIRDHDVVIHLAGVMPPISNIKKELNKLIDYDGTKNIIDAINLYNNKCYMIYPSTTTIYGKTKSTSITINNEAKMIEKDYYSNNKYEIEKMITKNLKYYTIFRLPIILSDNSNNVIYHIPNNQEMELIKSSDAAFVLTSIINNKTKYNKKTYNLTGGKKYYTSSEEYLIANLKSYGLSWKYIISKIFVDKTYYIHRYKDGTILSKELTYITGNINKYYNKIHKNNKYKRLIRKLLAVPIIYMIKRRVKK